MTFPFAPFLLHDPGRLEGIEDTRKRKAQEPCEDKRFVFHLCDAAGS